MCVCKKSFVLRLFTPSKMKRGLIAFHLAYVQVPRVPTMEAIVPQTIFYVLQAVTSVVSFQDAIQESKDVAGT